MRAIVVETGKVVEVERGEPMDNPMGWHSQMWLTYKEGNMYHEDELVMI
ncbi:MAG: hypothetical protein IIW50_01000 [Alistipes sp.]|nr:hypothetical protein [Alistipes sp.]